MADIVTLGMRVDSSELVRATENLERFKRASAGVDTATRQLATSTGTLDRETRQAAVAEQQHAVQLQRVAEGTRRASVEINKQAAAQQQSAISAQRMGQMHARALEINEQMTRRMAQMHAQAIRLNAAFDAQRAATSGAANAMGKTSLTARLLGVESLRSASGFGRLNDAALTTVRSTTGLSSTMAKLIDVFSTLRFGAPLMAGVFLGIAGLTKLMNVGKKAAEEYAEKINESVKALRDLRNEREYAGTYELRKQVADVRAKQALLVSEDIQPLVATITRGHAPALDPGREYLIREKLLPKMREWQELQRDIAAAEAAIAEATASSSSAIDSSTDALTGASGAADQYSAKLREMYAVVGALNAEIGTTVQILDRMRAVQLQQVAETAREFRDVSLPVRDENGRVRPGFGLQGPSRPQGYGGYNTGPGGVRYPTQLLPTTTRSSGGGFGAAQVGQAALVGGGLLAASGALGSGYAQSGLTGALGGAAAGAALGSIVPVVGTAVGAVVGAVGGFVAGLFGHGKKVREEAKRLKEAQREFDAHLRVRQALIAGESDRAESLRLTAMHEKELADARKAGLSRQSIATLQVVQYEEKLALIREQEAAKVQELAVAEAALAEARERSTQLIEDLTVRALRATGLGNTADRLGLQFSQRRERGAAIAGGAGAGDIATLDTVHIIERQALQAHQDAEEQIAAIEAAMTAQLDAMAQQEAIANEQLRVAQDQLRTQERTVNDLARTRDLLASFGDSLKVGQFSALSPVEQLTEARRQVETLNNLAQGGDITAAQSLPGAIRTLLDQSRGYNASGAGYVQDFQRSQEIVGGLERKFGRQLTVEERILGQLEKQTKTLEQQIKELQAQQETTRKNAQDQINAVIAARDAQISVLQAQVLQLFGINTQAGRIETNTGLELLQAKELLGLYERQIVPGLIEEYEGHLAAKDKAYGDQINKLVVALNGYIQDSNKTPQWAASLINTTAAASRETVNAVNSVKNSMDQVNDQLRLNGELNED